MSDIDQGFKNHVNNSDLHINKCFSSYETPTQEPCIWYNSCFLSCAQTTKLSLQVTRMVRSINYPATVFKVK